MEEGPLSRSGHGAVAGEVRLTCRPEGPGDAALIRRLYVTGRGAALCSAGLPADMIDQLVDLQLAARQQAVGTIHPHAERMIFGVDGQDVARLVLDRSTHPWHVVDIAVAPEWRNQGLGSRLLRQAHREAARAGLDLYVAVDNPARRLYERLGFQVTSADGADLLMTWTAG